MWLGGDLWALINQAAPSELWSRIDYRGLGLLEDTGTKLSASWLAVHTYVHIQVAGTWMFAENKMGRAT